MNCTPCFSSRACSDLRSSTKKSINTCCGSSSRHGCHCGRQPPARRRRP
jgi:hypothetical protein